MKVNINTNIISELLNQHSDKELVFNKKFPDIEEWQRKEDRPTLTEVTKMANFFHVPFGYFFLDKLPLVTYPVPHYRSGLVAEFAPSDELLETIKTIEGRQNWARNLRKEFGIQLPFVKSLTIKSDVKTAAKKIREILKLNTSWSIALKGNKWDDAFRYLIRVVEETGIFVVVNGVVNNSNKRKLRVEEFRGFVLYDEIAPFIFINNNDFISAKIFTLMHEVVHVFIGQSASFENKELLPAKSEIEIFCDAVAAEILVPENILLNEFMNHPDINLEKLASSFKVSRLMISKRLYTLGVIPKVQYESNYNNFKSSATERVVRATNGGNFYHTVAYRIGRSFFNLIYSGVKQNKILYRDAFRLTTLTPKSFDGYVKKFIR